MPALPLVNKVLRADFLQTIGADTTALNRLFFAFTGTLSTADATTLATTFGNAWATNIVAQQTSIASLQAVRVTDLSSALGAQVLVTHAATATGTNPGPAALSMVIKFKISLRYRGGHPRLYLGGLSPTFLTSGDIWSSTLQSSVLTAWNSFMTACLASPPAAVGTLTHVSVKYFSGFTVVTNPITHRAHNIPTLLGTPQQFAVQSYTINPKAATQRRRNLQ